MALPNSVAAIRAVLLLVGVAGLILGLYLWWKYRAGRPRGLNFWRRFFRMSRRDAIVLGVILLVSALFQEFTPETFALVWHLRYGSTARIRNNAVGTYEVPVPLFWSASRDFGEMRVDMSVFPGRFRAVYLGAVMESVTVGFDFGISPGVEAQKDLWRVDEVVRTKTTASPRSIAGQATTCFERRDPKLGSFLSVDCRPAVETHGLSASFVGFEKSLPDFYAILSQVKKK